MIRKKLVASGVALGLIGMASFGQLAQASQTIDGQTTGEIRTIGELGREDNTDPGGGIPDGDDRWINVTVPVEVIFYNLTDSTEIKSSDKYEVLNNSGRPVKVDLTSYRIANTDAAERQAVSKLNLVNSGGVGFSPVELVDNGTEKVTTSQQLVKLANKNGDMGSTNDPGAKLTRFKFTGSVNEEKLTANQTTEIDSSLNLRFTALDMAGNVVNN